MFTQEPAIYNTNNEDKDVAQIFVEMIEENIKKIHKKFDFATKMILQMKTGVSSTMQHIAGSASVHWKITKTALRPGQRLTSEGPLPFHGEVSWSSSLQMQEAEVHSCHLSQLGKL